MYYGLDKLWQKPNCGKLLLTDINSGVMSYTAMIVFEPSIVTIIFVMEQDATNMHKNAFSLP